MTSKNDELNWLVITVKGTNPPKIVHFDQAENIARKYAEDWADKNPGVTVCVYKREGSVRTVPTAKWE